MDLTLLLLRRFALRHWKSAPGRSALLVLILALGVAVFLSIRLANRAAVASFENFGEALTGRSDWVIEAPVGTLPMSVLSELRSALGPRPVAIVPIVEAAAARAGDSPASVLERETYTLIGIDLIGISNLRAAGEADPAMVRRSGACLWVPPALARARSLRLAIDGRRLELPVAGTIPVAAGAPEPSDHLLVMDLPELQKLTGKRGRVDRVELLVEAGPGADERRAELRGLLEHRGAGGARWIVRAPGAGRETAARMTEAFRLNLTILSLIALLVGLYLIFQALDGAVVRRRGEIAILRALGVEESAIRRAWLLEASLLGLAGGGLGLLLGWGGAQAAVRAVARTVNVLYFATTVRSVGVGAGEAVFALALGVAAGAAAGWWPARDAARTPPAQLLARGGAVAPGARGWAGGRGGIVLIGIGAALAALPPLPLSGGGRFPLAGYAAALAWILGGGMVCSASLAAAGGLARGCAGRSAAARVAVGHLRRPSGRHRLAASALLCAVGMAAGMAILVASFEQTIRDWVSRALDADLYVSSAGPADASLRSRISGATARALAAEPGVAASEMLSTWPVQLGEGPPALLNGADLEADPGRGNFSWMEAPRDGAIFDPRRNAGLALVSESFSSRFRVHRGDPVSLPTPAGRQTLVVAGVFSDYGNERGSVLVERSRLAGWMGDDAVSHLSLMARPGVDRGALRAVLQREYPGLRIVINSALRGEILRIFRQTFAITYALEIIGVFVAVAGLALSLASLLLERRDEMTTLRALGFARRDLARASAWEGAAVAAWGAGGGLVVSLGLGWILIHVINKQSFGWTLEYRIPGLGLAGLAAIVSLAGGGVSHAVGWWGARLPADREE